MATDSHVSACQDALLEHNERMTESASLVHHYLAKQAGTVVDLRHALTVLGHLHGRVETALGTIEMYAAIAKEYATECGQHSSEVWKPTARSAVAATKVFAIPELMEQILNGLEVGSDLLSATQVNKAMHSVVESSPCLQQRLGLSPNKDGHWYTPFQEGQFGDLLACRIDKYYQYDGWGPQQDEKEFSIDQPKFLACFQNDGYRMIPGSIPHVGSKMRKAKLCTPPVYELRVKLSCCGDSRRREDDQLPDPKPIEPITNQNGITAGDLCDFAMRASEEHRLCSYESAYLLDKDGIAHPDFHFSGTLQLNADGPAIATRRRSMELFERAKNSTNTAEDVPNVRAEYTTAKRAALIAGDPIPTLAEYMASVARITAETAQEEDGKALNDDLLWL